MVSAASSSIFANSIPNLFDDMTNIFLLLDIHKNLTARYNVDLLMIDMPVKFLDGENISRAQKR